jgi:hypothetical protein
MIVPLSTRLMLSPKLASPVVCSGRVHAPLLFEGAGCALTRRPGFYLRLQIN